MAEFFVLGFLEFATCFLLALAVIAGGGIYNDAVTIDLALVLAAALAVMSLATGAYRGENFMRSRGVLTKFILALLFSMACALVLVALRDDQNGPGDLVCLKLILSACLACLALNALIRTVFGYALRSGVFVRRLVLAGPADSCARLRRSITARTCGTFEVIAEFDLAAADALDQIAQARSRDIWAIVVAQPAELTGLAAAGMPRIIAAPEFWERYMQRIDLDTLEQNILPDSRSHGLSALLHRLTDIALSLGLLFFTLPLMLATIIAIRFDSPGPILYRQDRVGLGGKPFVLTKFRSMRPDAEASGPVWAMLEDKRITRVGQFIRLTRIDELPQLFNILRGEMSFIGPRPERPVFVAQLIEQIPFYADRSAVKPGLTGWAQVNYPYGASVEDAKMKLSYDLYYVKHQSFWLDMVIVFSTIRVILFQEGAR